MSPTRQWAEEAVVIRGYGEAGEWLATEGHGQFTVGPHPTLLWLWPCFSYLSVWSIFFSSETTSSAPFSFLLVRQDISLNHGSLPVLFGLHSLYGTKITVDDIICCRNELQENWCHDWYLLSSSGVLLLFLVLSPWPCQILIKLSSFYLMFL